MIEKLFKQWFYINMDANDFNNYNKAMYGIIKAFVSDPVFEIEKTGIHMLSNEKFFIPFSIMTLPQLYIMKDIVSDKNIKAFQKLDSSKRSYNYDRELRSSINEVRLIKMFLHFIINHVETVQKSPDGFYQPPDYMSKEEKYEIINGFIHSSMLCFKKVCDATIFSRKKWTMNAESIINYGNQLLETYIQKIEEL